MLYSDNILVKNVGALDTAKFDSHFNNKHSNPPSHVQCCLLDSKVLHNID